MEPAAPSSRPLQRPPEDTSLWLSGQRLAVVMLQLNQPNAVPGGGRCLAVGTGTPKRGSVPHQECFQHIGHELLMIAACLQLALCPYHHCD